MTEPSRQEMLHAVAALGPFVRRWGLSLNPEDIDEIAYAVLRHHRSDDDLEAVDAMVEAQIDEYEARMRRLYDAMREHRGPAGDRRDEPDRS